MIAASGSTRQALTFIPPIEVAGLFQWFDTRTLAGVEVAGPNRYARALCLPHGPGVLAIEHCHGQLKVDLRTEHALDRPILLAHARRLFDLNTNPAHIDAALGSDPRLAVSVAQTPGIRIPGIVDLHEALVRAILGQQVTVARARAQTQVLVDELGEEVGLLPQPGCESPWPDRLFPTAEALAERAGAHIRGPATRTKTLVTVCAAIASGELALDRETPYEHFVDVLRSFRGIGPWTADYVALRYLGHRDLVLPGDVAIRTGARRLGFGDSPGELVREAERFAPWRSYLMMHLWKAASGPEQPGAAR